MDVLFAGLRALMACFCGYSGFMLGGRDVLEFKKVDVTMDPAFYYRRGVK